MSDASEVLVERLLAWGVDTVFGLPGDGINGVFEALRKQKERIRFIHVRHEEAAAFMAFAYAKFTGRLGGCIATSGPGGIHLLNGLYDAKMDHALVLAVTGLAKRPKPRNLLDLMFDPAGMRPFVEEWEKVAAGLLQRVRREAGGHVLDGGLQK